MGGGGGGGGGGGRGTTMIVCSLGKIYSPRCTTNMFIEVFQIVFNQIG